MNSGQNCSPDPLITRTNAPNSSLVRRLQHRQLPNACSTPNETEWTITYGVFSDGKRTLESTMTRSTATKRLTSIVGPKGHIVISIGPKANAGTKFKVGDRVRIPGAIHYKGTGKVVGIAKSSFGPLVVVRFPNRGQAECMPNVLKKVR